jgi:hypothetical protein
MGSILLIIDFWTLSTNGHIFTSHIQSVKESLVTLSLGVLPKQDWKRLIFGETRAVGLPAVGFIVKHRR